jgi:hypothetical protein
MKFLIAKNDNNICHNPTCGANILRGEEVVLHFYVKPGFRHVFFFHVKCFMPWYESVFNENWSNWKSGKGNDTLPVRGKPVIITEPTKEDMMNRLRSNLCYHKSKGHSARVALIEGKIASLTKGR